MVNFWFFNVWIIKRKFFELVYYIWIRFNFLQNCHCNKEHNEKWPYIPDHPYRILVIGGSGSGKTNVLLNLIKQQGDIDNLFVLMIYLYAKDLSEPRHQFLL